MNKIQSVFLRLALVILCVFSVSAMGQTPQLSFTGLPAEPLIGETFCATIEFQNGGGAPGYGPYIFITVPPQILVTSATFLDVSPDIQLVGIIDESGEITDPISGIVVSGEPGGNASILRIPVGSVLEGQPPLIVDSCAVVLEGAEIGTPLDVEFLPGFEFGDSPTGEGGPITGTGSEPGIVTPQLARIDKSSTVVEGQRPPGPSHTYQYTYTVNVSVGVTIENLVLADDLPLDLQWDGSPISVNAIDGALCRTTSEPNLPAVGPGGLLQVNCFALTGTISESDLVVTLPVYIVDVLDETGPDSKTIPNTVDYEYSYDEVLYTGDDTETVTAVHVEAYKSASPDPVVPGDIVTFAVNFSVTDYSAGETLEALVLDDILSNGLEFIDNSNLVVNGVNFPVIAEENPDPPPDSPVGAGETAVRWDIVSAVGGPIPVASRGRLTYQALVLQSFNNGNPVVAGDPLGNRIDLSYIHSEGAEDSNGSNSGVDIESTSSDKLIVSPDPVPESFQPGDELTFRLEMSIPSGDSYDVTLVDFLPLPVIFVQDIDVNTDVALAPPPYLQTTPSIAKDNATNSISFGFGDISSDGPEQLAVDLTVTITGQPFSDGLFLTNLLQASSTNSAGEVDLQTHAVGIKVGAPKMVLTKGVLSVDNPAATITPPAPADPSQELADSNAENLDAGDIVEFVLTAENLGSKPAYNLAFEDPAIPGLDCAPLTPQDVTDGQGQPLSFSGSLLEDGIVVDGPVQGNDGVPSGGGAPFSNDTVLIRQTCTLTVDVAAGSTLVNTASMTFTSTADSTDEFPSVSDDAQLAIAIPEIAKRRISIEPGYSTEDGLVHIGEIVTYEVDVTLPEGTVPDFKLEDVLDRGLAFVPLTDSDTDVFAEILVSPGVSTSVAGGFDPGVLGNISISAVGDGEESLDRRLRIGPGNNDYGFGTVTNSNTDNSTPEKITLRYRARVLNWTGNSKGNVRNNKATMSWSLGGNREEIIANASDIQIIEPKIVVDKLFNPSSADQGNPSTFRIKVKHAGGSDATAFGVLLTDLLPRGLLTLDLASLKTINCNLEPDQLEGSQFLLEASWAEFPIGSECTIEVDTTGSPPLPAGFQLQNCANVSWRSLAENGDDLAVPPNNPLGAARTGRTTDPGGAANDYTVKDCAILSIFDVDIDKQVESTDQDHTVAVDGIENLTVGEQATFLLTATLPEGLTTNLVVQDKVPFGGMIMEVISAEVLPLPDDTNLSIPDFPPVPVITDSNLGDGLDDTVAFVFGSPIQNTPDSVVDDRDRVRMRVTAVVKNLPVNEDGAEDSNVTVVQFGTGLNGSDESLLEVVEPLLTVTKRGQPDTVEAGDVVTYRVIVEHVGGSTAGAFDVELLDILPEETTLIAGSETVGRNCTHAPDAGPSGSGNTVVAEWKSFPLGAFCEISFQTEINIDAIAGSTITNEADILWTSLDEFGNSEDERLYSDSALYSTAISNPGLTKEITSSSIAETNGGNLTIGETAVFEVVVDFPQGTTADVLVADQLPFQNARLQLLDSELISIGRDLSFSEPVTIGSPGDHCEPNCDIGMVGFNNLASWYLGNVVNDPLSIDNLDLDLNRAVFEVTAIVVDDPVNQGIPLSPDFVYNDAILTAENELRRALAAITLVEPRLTLDHEIAGRGSSAVVGAGDVVAIELAIAHRSTSSATAFTVELDYQLNEKLTWTGDEVVTDCPGLTTDISALPMISFQMDSLPLGTRKCTIDFNVMVPDDIVVPDLFADTSKLSWESAPGSVETRAGEQFAQVRYLLPAAGSIGKYIVSTSVSETGSEQYDPLQIDLTIGESITYDITAGLGEGTTENVVISDLLPDDLSGRIELLGARVDWVGSQITTSLPGTPVIANNGVTFDFGTVVNVADGITNQEDTIRVRITGRLVNDTDTPHSNVDGNVLSNQGELTFTGGSDSSIASIDVVEPDLQLLKQFGPVVQNQVEVTFELINAGTAPAFSASISDVFEETSWVASSMVPVLVPEGWELSQNFAGGETTVIFAPLGVGAFPSPQQIIFPGDSRTVIFTMELVEPAPETTIPNTAFSTANSLKGRSVEGRIYDAEGNDTLLLPDLVSEKTWSGSSFPVAVPGETITYEVQVINNGAGSATNIVVTDTPDELGEFMAGSVTSANGTVVSGNFPGDTSIEVMFDEVGAGEVASFTYQVQVPSPYPSATVQEFINQAMVSYDEGSDFLSDDDLGTLPSENPTLVPIVADPVLQITKTGTPGAIGAGGSLFYAIDFANTGNQDATGVVISDVVPPNTTFDAANSTAGWSCADASPPATECVFDVGDLAGLSGDTITFAVRVDNPVPVGVFEVNNTVVIVDDGLNSDNGQILTDQDSEVTPIIEAPVLEISKTDGDITAQPGQQVVYTLDFANTGDRDAAGVVIRDTVPRYTRFDAAGSLPTVWDCADGSGPLTICETFIGDLDSDEAGSVRFAVRVDSVIPPGVELTTNVVLITDDGTASGGFPALNFGLDQTPILAQPDLVVNKSDGDAIAQPGQVIKYQIDYTNSGNQGSTGVLLQETVPAGSVYSAIGSTPDVWSCADNSPPGTVCELNVGDLAVGAVGAASFGVLVDDPLPQGQSEIINVVTILDDGTNGPDPTPENNTDTENTLFERLPSEVGLEKTVESSNQAHTGSVSGFEELAIGEEVTFLITATLEEGVTTGLVVVDNLPHVAAVLEVISADVPPLPSDTNLILSGFPPTPVIEDRFLGDGIDDTVVFDFGTDITNNPDGVVDDRDRLFMLVTAVVRDLGINTSRSEDANRALVQMGDGLDGMAQADIRLLEPSLSLLKVGDTNTVEAGDIINFVLSLEHAPGSDTDAFDVTVVDFLPLQMQVVADSLRVDEVCTVVPDELTSNSIGVNAFWSEFPLGSRCDITFQARVNITAVTGTAILNRATAQWFSLDDTVDSDDDRSYNDRAEWVVIVSDPGLTKDLVATSIDATPGNQLTIGETGTFEILAEFPNGTTVDTSVFDQLPYVNARLEVVSSRIKTIGGDIRIGADLDEGSPGIDCEPDCDTGDVGFTNLAQWNLGLVTNLSMDNGTSNAGQIIFEVVGIVKDVPENQGIPESIDFVFNNGALTALGQNSVDLAPVTLVEPRLDLTHDIVGNSPFAVVSAGEILTIELVVSHEFSSSATAFSTLVDYQLNDQVLWVGDNTVQSDCDGLVTDSSGLQSVLFEIGELPLFSLECSIRFEVQMSPALPVPGAYLDRSFLTWESAPGSTESRLGSVNRRVVYLAPSDAAFSKQIKSTSLPNTGSEIGDPIIEDLAIGELVTYRLIAALDEGTTDPVIISDQLPDSASGRLIVEAASIELLGSNISTSLAGTPQISGNSVQFDFGSVTNTADGVTDDGDLIVVNITARAIDEVVNQSGLVLTNSAELVFGGSSLSDQVSVELIEPVLDISKSFGELTMGRVDIDLTLTNTGNAPAFVPVISDTFDDVVWDTDSIIEVVTPTGWVRTSTSAGNFTTITYAPESSPAEPEPGQILLPGASIQVVFNLALNAPITETSILNEAIATAESLPAFDDNAREYVDNGTATLNTPALDVLKSWSGPANPAVPGDVLTYTIEIINSGSSSASNLVLADMPDPIGLFQAGSVVASAGQITSGNTAGDAEIEVVIATLGAGDSVTVSYDVAVPAPYPAATPEQFVNQANLTSDQLQDVLSDDPSTGVGDDDPTITPILADPVMQINKDDLSDVVGAGGVIYYILDYANAGDQNATGVTITETVPANTVFSEEGSQPSSWSCSDGSGPGTECVYLVGDLAGSESGSVTFAVQVDNPLGADVTEVQNSALISDDGLNSGGVPSTDTDDDVTPVLAIPVLGITKDDGGITVEPGDVVVYELQYENRGVQDATGVLIRELVPANSTFAAAGSLPDVWDCPDGSAPGTICRLSVGDLAGQGQGSGVARFAVTVDTQLASGVEQINNLVLITDDGNNSALVPVIDLGFDFTPIEAQPDLVISKDDGGIIGFPGQVFSYDLQYQNVGNQGASGVVLNETVPVGMTYAAEGSGANNWSCADGAPAGAVCTLQIGEMPVGSSGSALFGARVDDPLPAGQAEVVNTVVISDDGLNGPDPTPENNTDTIATLVTLFPPAGRKSVEDLGNGKLRWTLTWFNNQNVTTLPVLVLDPIPDRSTYLAGTLACDAEGSSVCGSAVYQPDTDRIWVEADIAEDFGAPDLAPDELLDNEIRISFTTISNTASAVITNIGESCWDYNNTGSAVDDWENGQVCIPVTASSAVSVAIPVNAAWARVLLVLLMMSLAWVYLGSARPPARRQ